MLAEVEAAAPDLVVVGGDVAAGPLPAETLDRLAAFEPTVSADGVLFCHGSPRSDEEIITAVTPEERLAPMFEGVAEGPCDPRLRGS